MNTCATCVYFVPCNQDKKSGGCFGPVERWIIKPDAEACEEYQEKETSNDTRAQTRNGHGANNV